MIIFAVISPSTSSVDVAPRSVYIPPTVTFTGFEPRIVIIGSVISAVATTFTVLVAVALFNAASETV